MIDRACISLSDRCNLKCRYCHFQEKQSGSSVFACEEVERVIKNIHAYCSKSGLRTFKLGIVGSGEPLLEKDILYNMLDFIQKKRFSEFQLYTITNGTLLDEETIRSLLEYRSMLKICISLDGYEEIHNYGRSKFTRVMEAVTLYKALFQSSPAINATVNLQSYLNKEKVISFFLDNELTEVTFSRIFGCHQKDLAVTREQFVEFLAYARSSGIISRQFSNMLSYDCAMYGKLCGVGRTNIFITPEGIYPCGRFYRLEKYKLGNCTDSLFFIEEKCNELDPVENGLCFYEARVEEKK